MGANDELDLRELDVLGALRASALELERTMAALADAERELDAAEAALHLGAGPEVRRTVEALLPELGCALALDVDDEVVARSPHLDPASLPAHDDLVAVAAAARAAAPEAVRHQDLRAVAVGRSAPIVVVVIAPEP